MGGVMRGEYKVKVRFVEKMDDIMGWEDIGWFCLVIF